MVSEVEHLLIAILEHRMMLPEAERNAALADEVLGEVAETARRTGADA